MADAFPSPRSRGEGFVLSPSLGDSVVVKIMYLLSPASPPKRRGSFPNRWWR
jgi:hypothetical protein